MKNRYADLHNHLFEQLERLNDDALTPEKLDQEVKRADAMVKIADRLVAGAAPQLKASTLIAEHGASISDVILAAAKVEQKARERRAK